MKRLNENEYVLLPLGAKEITKENLFQCRIWHECKKYKGKEGNQARVELALVLDKNKRPLRHECPHCEHVLPADFVKIAGPISRSESDKHAERIVNAILNK